MRRWQVWAIVAVILVSLVVVLAQLPKPPPYGFLRSHKPVPVFDGHMRPVEADPSLLTYSFKADSRRLIERAEKELKAAGLKRFDEGGIVSFRKSASFDRKNPLRVDIQLNMRTTGIVRVESSNRRFGRISMHTPMGANTNGWVTVRVSNAPEPTWMDRFRAWMGL